MQSRFITRSPSYYDFRDHLQSRNPYEPHQAPELHSSARQSYVANSVVYPSPAFPCVIIHPHPLVRNGHTRSTFTWPLTSKLSHESIFSSFVIHSAVAFNAYRCSPPSLSRSGGPPNPYLHHQLSIRYMRHETNGLLGHGIGDSLKAPKPKRRAVQSYQKDG
ncbi:hypothetical protein P691DRAFT_481808 [Macrolepiota fuliginosa MF-IS2]|uniref:Uncharacterized protein n=1 Tax=Macrolepiota fuliginosa MF-IS2 TaxID=1400762 RepID=A0A9P6BYF5_9AGAR|nr:hypothetical protein P691DRAFT_481808 [Macrolepiota fuliginosa MF-IS2]